MINLEGNSAKVLALIMPEDNKERGEVFSDSRMVYYFSLKINYEYISNGRI